MKHRPELGRPAAILVLRDATRPKDVRSNSTTNAPPPTDEQVVVGDLGVVDDDVLGGVAMSPRLGRPTQSLATNAPDGTAAGSTASAVATATTGCQAVGSWRSTRRTSRDNSIVFGRFRP
jgi:hypothetical protein